MSLPGQIYSKIVSHQFADVNFQKLKVNGYNGFPHTKIKQNLRIW